MPLQKIPKGLVGELLKGATPLASNGHDRFPRLVIELHALSDH